MLLVSTWTVPGVSKGEVVDKIVAVINDGIITLSELNAAVALDPETLKPDSGARKPA